MRILKFNEGLEPHHATYGYLFNACKVTNVDQKEYFEGKWKTHDYDDEFVFNEKYQLQKIKDGYIIEKDGLIFVFNGDSETPDAIFHQLYEQHGHTEFENMLVFYGHENILMYNREANTFKKIRTR